MSTIYRNKRRGPNDFSQVMDCSFCDSYVPQVLELVTKNNPNGPKPLICRSCLDRFAQELDQNMVAHFQSDFEEARADVVNNQS
jgi:hypothetical protein